MNLFSCISFKWTPIVDRRVLNPFDINFSMPFDLHYYPFQDRDVL